MVCEMFFYDAVHNAWYLAVNVSPSHDKAVGLNDKRLRLCFTRTLLGRSFAMPEYLVPGVFVEELSLLPPSVAEVDSALPAFIGYTAQAVQFQANDLNNVPRRIRSLAEFESCYGKGPAGTVTRIDVDRGGNFLSASIDAPYFLYEALRLFYANGGGDCYIVSVGRFAASGKADFNALLAGLQAVAAVDEPTLLLFPDAVALGEVDLGKLQQAALDQCARLQDRFAVFDLDKDDCDGARLRRNLGGPHLQFGAAYTPWLAIHREMVVDYASLRDKLFQAGHPIALRALVSEPAVLDLLTELDALCAAPPGTGLNDEIAKAEQRLADAWPLYRRLLQGIAGMTVLCPPSGAVVGIYARVDRERGVWKAPANIVVNGIAGLGATYTSRELDAFNVDVVAGKSINPIRQVSGKGWLLLGGRTLAGNDNEWRYVSVRRFFNMVEESLRKSAARYVFEPNDANTWGKVRAMIENYLVLKWRDGALAGSRADQAFFVKCGLNETMTAQDVLDGRLIIEVGLAVVRPAEFIIFRLVQPLQGG